MPLQDELRCIGLLGLGAGFEWGLAKIKPDEKLDGRDGYCAKTCVDSARCMVAHRMRCRIKYPRATKEFDRMMESMSQQDATLLWRKLHPQTPLEPYALQMTMNCEDGLAIAQTGEPKDRGAHRLQWPRT